MGDLVKPKAQDTLAKSSRVHESANPFVAITIDTPFLRRLPKVSRPKTLRTDLLYERGNNCSMIEPILKFLVTKASLARKSRAEFVRGELRLQASLRGHRRKE